ncbi:MAG: ATP-dependent RecD-like DNA helicase [Deltaproteobacteria bacterium]|nr:ATP-dependent RecD-like DNA helicase [Deltaproteobacteria bacterium]MBW2308717.1 ATP-dependent RecD-like DNA helicase [Deltaproteobacteria bacterium]
MEQRRLGQHNEETLSGSVERITFASDVDMFTVAKMQEWGKRDLTTIVGNFSPINPGESIRVTGRWESDRRFGRQFRVTSLTVTKPATIVGIEKYLGSGMIQGIGPGFARRLVKAFGDDTLDVIDHKPERLREVEGIGPKRVAMIIEAWKEQKEIRNIMIFLQSHGVSTLHSARIFKFYGSRAIQAVTENPYRLARDIQGIGFITADRIARNMGIPDDSPVRARAGLIYALLEAADEGNVCYPHEKLLERAAKVLAVERKILGDALEALWREGDVIIEKGIDGGKTARGEEMVYLSGFHLAECAVARGLHRILEAPSSLRHIHSRKALEWVQQRIGMELSRGQCRAVTLATNSKVMVITGGPGTGKTTVLRALLEIFHALKARVLLAAPTGRAAKRMAESTGHEARTIHRLLEYSPKQGTFLRNERHPLDADIVVLDEASMIDLLLFHQFLKAVPPMARLILVGDVNQIPSVGPGRVLGEIIDSHQVDVVAMTEIFRQARQSLIVVNSHRILEGKMPHSTEREGDFFLIWKEEPEEILRTVLELCSKRLPRTYGLDPVENIQVISPMHRGEIGTERLNMELQRVLNPMGREFRYGTRAFRTGDKVMQVRNNYDREVFNGDIGRVVRVNEERGWLVVRFDEREVAYQGTDLDELAMAYAVSVHKSQGSEYQAVILPLHTCHYLMLQRNLLYTGITRGRRLVILVAAKKALAIAVANDRTQQRFTGLAERLRKPFDSVRLSPGIL